MRAASFMSSEIEKLCSSEIIAANLISVSKKSKIVKNITHGFNVQEVEQAASNRLTLIIKIQFVEKCKREKEKKLSQTNERET